MNPDTLSRDGVGDNDVDGDGDDEHNDGDDRDDSHKDEISNITTATNALAKLYSTLAKRPSKIELLEGIHYHVGAPW